MNCKDCINADVCNCCDDEATETIATNIDENSDCKLFKDKSKFIELPFDLFDEIYIVDGLKINKDVIRDMFFYGNYIRFRISELNKTIFLTLEEAEAKLKEMEDKQNIVVINGEGFYTVNGSDNKSMLYDLISVHNTEDYEVAKLIAKQTQQILNAESYKVIPIPDRDGLSYYIRIYSVNIRTIKIFEVRNETS